MYFPQGAVFYSVLGFTSSTLSFQVLEIIYRVQLKDATEMPKLPGKLSLLASLK